MRVLLCFLVPAALLLAPAAVALLIRRRRRKRTPLWRNAVSEPAPDLESLGIDPTRVPPGTVAVVRQHDGHGARLFVFEEGRFCSVELTPSGPGLARWHKANDVEAEA